jgi:hypothetical protein
MYKNNFAAAIKVNGKILREFGDTVYLPFGSEYQIRLKNLNSARAHVSIEIDGDNVTDGGLVLNAYETSDLERFIRNGNLKEGNRFKFIERTSKIEDHRGIKLEDGIITIRYKFERPMPILTRNVSYRAGGCGSMIKGSSEVYGVDINSHDGFACIDTPLSASMNDTGITVEGSKSNQSFTTTYWRGAIGSVEVMNIKLLGETEENKMIREPVTVKTKLRCKTCGTINSATAKFCSECGTSLQII